MNDKFKTIGELVDELVNEYGRDKLIVESDDFGKLYEFDLHTYLNFKEDVVVACQIRNGIYLEGEDI